MTANYDDRGISVSALDAPHVHKIYSDRTIYFPIVLDVERTI